MKILVDHFESVKIFCVASIRSSLILSVSRCLHTGVAVNFNVLYLLEMSTSPQCPGDMKHEHRRLPSTPESELLAL